jgi:hypothetical protein
VDAETGRIELAFEIRAVPGPRIRTPGHPAAVSSFVVMRPQNAILILALLALFALALLAPFGMWPWSHGPADFRVPLLSFFVSLVLVAVTWRYVIITRDQLIELRSAQEPQAALSVRIPPPESQDINYGRGNNQFRKGPPIFLDVWNVGGPTIMVTRVTVKVNCCPGDGSLTPQVIVESGKVASVNVAYEVVRTISTSKPHLDLPDDYTQARADFTVEYFSKGGTRSIRTQSDLWFFTSDRYITISTDDPSQQLLALQKLMINKGSSVDGLES